VHALARDGQTGGLEMDGSVVAQQKMFSPEELLEIRSETTGVVNPRRAWRGCRGCRGVRGTSHK
jgi:hypothetical protein